MQKKASSKNPLFQLPTIKKPVKVDARSLKHLEEDYKDIYYVSTIKKSDHPILLMKSPSLNQSFAVKVYPIEDDTKPLNKYYLNEKRALDFNHPNIIPVVKCIDQFEFGLKPGQKSSCVLMNRAKYGHFFPIFDGIITDDFFIRTYFHQIIDVIEYMESKGYGHMNLKFDNLLLGDDFQLKICDFKYCYKYRCNEQLLIGKGTRNYRPYEMAKGIGIERVKTVDIFAAGVILFAMKFGMLPYDEKEEVYGYNLMEMLEQRRYKEFWIAVEKLTAEDIPASEEFKELFKYMTHVNPNLRPLVPEIKKYAWYNGPTFTRQGLKYYMLNLMEKRKLIGKVN